jgi:DNA polymerase-3 subunit delta
MISKSYLLESNINQIDKNLILFYGENLGLKNDFKSKIKLNNKKIKIINFTQEEILKNEYFFFSEILNISLFEEEKIFFINNANDKIIPIIQEVEKKTETQKIYLFSDILEKKSKLRNYFEKKSICIAVACYADNEISIKKIILNKLKGFEGLSSENINLIVNNCNLDRITLNNELEKIFSYFTNKKINNKELEKILDIRINDNFNLLKDAALNGNKIETNKLLSDTIIDADKNVFYLALINQRLNKLAEAAQLSKTTNLEDAISRIKPPIFWKDKPGFKEQAKKWNLGKIKLILKETYDLEIKIKSEAIIEKNVLVKKLIVDMCNMANS